MSAAVAQAEAQRGRWLTIARRVLGPGPEAEDVVQEVLTRLVTCEALPDCLPAWLTAVTYRCALNVQRAQARRLGAEPLPAGAVGASEDPAHAAERAELAAAALAALEALPDPYRAALRLRYREGLGYPELAARLEAPERTARTWVGRGLQRLRDALEGRS